MKDCTENTCDCPACTLDELLRKTIADGFPPELIVPMVLDVLQGVVEEYGINAFIREVNEFQDDTVH